MTDSSYRFPPSQSTPEKQGIIEVPNPSQEAGLLWSQLLVISKCSENLERLVICGAMPKGDWNHLCVQIFFSACIAPNAKKERCERAIKKIWVFVQIFF